MTKEDFLILVFIMLSLFFFVIAVLLINFWINSIKCSRRWESFENQYEALSGCQIKVDGKWIPSDSYYFKEE